MRGGGEVSGLRAILSQKREQLAVQWLRLTFGKRDFCVVSNNCWGAHIYQALGMAYQSPFIGLFLMPDCYLKLLANFRTLLKEPLKFKDSSVYPQINERRRIDQANYPIGSLSGEVEIQFLHYASRKEAADKWNRRISRMPAGDEEVFVKFCDREGCSREHLERFDALPFRHKVCFTTRRHIGIKSVIQIPNCGNDYVPDGLELSRASHRFFDARNWIEGGSGRPRWWSRLRIL